MEDFHEKPFAAVWRIFLNFSLGAHFCYSGNPEQDGDGDGEKPPSSGGRPSRRAMPKSLGKNLMRPTFLAISLLFMGAVACRRASESTPKSSAEAQKQDSTSETFLTDPTDIGFHEQIDECDQQIKMLETALAHRSDVAQFIEAAEKAKPEGKELPQEAQELLDERNAMRARIKDIESRRRDLIKQAEEWRRRTTH